MHQWEKIGEKIEEKMDKNFFIHFLYYSTSKESLYNYGQIQ